jgi:hypothetical protein
VVAPKKWQNFAKWRKNGYFLAVEKAIFWQFFGLVLEF